MFVFQVIITILGMATAVLYVGFMAYSIGAIPLWVIVIGTFALMIREFVVELRNDARRAAQASGRN